jgi:hypothetical protein
MLRGMWRIIPSILNLMMICTKMTRRGMGDVDVMAAVGENRKRRRCCCCCCCCGRASLWAPRQRREETAMYRPPATIRRCEFGQCCRHLLSLALLIDYIYHHGLYQYQYQYLCCCRCKFCFLKGCVIHSQSSK